MAHDMPLDGLKHTSQARILQALSCYTAVKSSDRSAAGTQQASEILQVWFQTTLIK